MSAFSRFRGPATRLAACMAPPALPGLALRAASLPALLARWQAHAFGTVASAGGTIGEPSSTSSGTQVGQQAPVNSTTADRQQHYVQQQRQQQQQQQDESTVSESEAAKFAALANEWWDPSGPFAPLHAMNPVRCRFLRSALCSAFARDATQPRPLQGLHLLDVGCGGGLLSESLARMGAHVTGIDVNQGGIETAQAHAALDSDLNGRLHYRTASAEQLVEAGELFDAVIASEVIEHVASVPAFCSALAALTRPGGGVAISTLNRTPRSYLAAVLVAEHVLRWVPPGTHEWERFVTPQELVMQMEESSGGSSSGGGAPLRMTLLAGMEYNPLAGSWALGTDTGINYIAFFSKPEAAVEEMESAAGAAAVGAAAGIGLRGMPATAEQP